MEGASVFITGSGGTGKSHLLNALREELYAMRRNVHVTASTGVAALEVRGVTLHSWAGIGLGNGDAAQLLQGIRRNPKAAKRWRTVDTLFIDEISMVDPELFEKLDYIARTLRRDQRPFGSIQVILFGDFFQLPPVQTQRNPQANGYEFCFETPAWEELDPVVVELGDVFRQSDASFVSILERVRRGEIDEEVAACLQSRVGAQLDTSDGIEATRLYSVNRDVNALNAQRLQQLEPETHHQYEARIDISGGTPQRRATQRTQVLKHCSAEERLELREGAQVMLLHNLDQERGLVNGSRGVVIGFSDTEPDMWYEATRVHSKNTAEVDLEEHGLPIVRFANGLIEPIARHRWTTKNEEEGMSTTLAQVPLKLAWAYTVHKSQGQTLDRVELDLSTVFSHGQSYVALSRVRSLEGLSISALSLERIRAHPKVVRFYKEAREHAERVRAAYALARQKREQV